MKKYHNIDECVLNQIGKWILIRWIRKKPADLGLQCFPKCKMRFQQEKCYNIHICFFPSFSVAEFGPDSEISVHFEYAQKPHDEGNKKVDFHFSIFSIQFRYSDCNCFTY